MLLRVAETMGNVSIAVKKGKQPSLPLFDLLANPITGTRRPIAPTHASSLALATSVAKKATVALTAPTIPRSASIAKKQVR